MKTRNDSFRKSGFTLIEIMIVVAIIGLLAAVAIPNLISVRKKAQIRACQLNLKAIPGAKEHWALDNRKSDADVPSDVDLFGRTLYIEAKPLCPAGGSYDLRAVSEKPTCTAQEHVLP